MLRFKHIFLIVCLYLVIESCLAIPTGNRKNVNKKPGSMKLKAKVEGGYEVKMNGNGHSNKKIMNEVQNPNMIIPDRMDDKTIKLYASADGNTTCMQECDPDGINCNTQCINQTQTGTQFYSDKYQYFLEFTSPDGTPELFHSSHFADFMEEEYNNGNSAKKKNIEEDDEYLVPSTSAKTGFVHFRFVICDSVANLFFDFVGQDYEATLDEVECLVGLLANQMSLSVSTLKFWNEKFTSTDGTKFKLDINVKIEYIEFPEFKNGKFTPLSPITDNIDDDGYLAINSFYNPSGAFLYETGVATDWAYYMKTKYSGSRVFQHMAVLTDYDIAVNYWTVFAVGPPVMYSRATGIIGFAKLRALCEDFSTYPFDRRFSFTEMFSPDLARITTHELGHSMGARHDPPGECGNFYLMYSALFPPLESYPLQNFFTFSQCSAKDISSYLSRFTNEELNICLFTKRPSRKEFLEQFCQGLPGTKYDIDAQCKLFHDLNSSVCWSDSNELQSGYVDQERCQLIYRGGSYRIIFKCTKDGQCSDGYWVLSVFDGTKCLNEDGTKGDMYCYQGQCQDFYEICQPEDLGDRK